MTKPPGNIRIEYYIDRRGEHRWRIKASNNKIIADSSEGYKNKADAQTAAEQVMGTTQSDE